MSHEFYKDFPLAVSQSHKPSFVHVCVSVCVRYKLYSTGYRDTL